MEFFKICLEFEIKQILKSATNLNILFVAQIAHRLTQEKFLAKNRFRKFLTGKAQYSSREWCKSRKKPTTCYARNFLIPIVHVFCSLLLVLGAQPWDV